MEDVVAEIDRDLQAFREETVVPEPRGETESPSISRRIIRFILNEIHFAVPLHSALEIGRDPRITPLPNLPNWVLGVANIRGEITSIVDLKSFLGMPYKGLKRHQRFIIIHASDIKVGILADRIIGIFSPEKIDTRKERLIKNASGAYGENWVHYVSGIVALEEAVVHVIDTEALLTDKRLNAFLSE